MVAPEPVTVTSRTGRTLRAGRLRWQLALGVVVAAAVASHAPVLDADFIRFDDTAYVESNPHVESGLRLDNVRWALTGYEQSNWHPLTWISHMIDVEAFGFAPRGHHAVNLALHALNVLLLFLVLRSLTGDAVPSLLVAGVFAVHPANVESVAWISQRKTLLCTCFALLAIAAYARHVRGGGRRPYAGSLGFLALSLMSKPMFVTFPFGLLLLDFWPLRRPAFERAAGGGITLAALVRGWWRLLPEKIPYLVLCGLVSLITLDAQQDAMSTIEHFSVPQRLGNVALSYVTYLGTFLAPFRLAVFYPLHPDRLTPRLVFGCAALLGAITIALVRLGLRRPYLLVGWLWFLGTLVPVIGLVQVGMQSMADRYVYVPFWGLAIALAWSLRDLLHVPLRVRAARWVATAAAAAVLGCLGVLTYRQAEKWRDPFTLFHSAIENTAGNWLAHALLAERYYAKSDFEKTVEHSIEAVKSSGNMMGAIRSTYGLALHDMGKLDPAREQFELAAQQDPDNPIGFMNLGWFELERGEYDIALAVLSLASTKIDDKTAPFIKKTTYANWASALAKTNQLGGAREKYGLALEVEPDNLDLLRDAARVDLRLNEPHRAIERMRRALEVDPNDADSAYLLASATALQGGESAELFARAQSIAPRQAIVTVELARTLAGDGRREDAARLLEILLALDPPADEADAQFVTSTVHDHLAQIAIERGDAARAIAELDRALAIWPDNYDAKSRLAFLLATTKETALRNPKRAVALAERAASERREFASLSTLAAAYAAAERMPAAVDAARQGLELASKAKDARGIAALQKQIDIYSRTSGALNGATRR